MIKTSYVASEFIALSLLVGICYNFDIYYSGYIQTHCQKKKIKRADQILPEVYGTTLIKPSYPLVTHGWSWSKTLNSSTVMSGEYPAEIISPGSTDDEIE